MADTIFIFEGGRLPKFEGTNFTVQERLDYLCWRAKELGGKYVHRYPQATGTKLWIVNYAWPFRQACLEAGVEYEVRNSSSCSGGTDFYIKDLTLQGSRGGQKAKKQA